MDDDISSEISKVWGILPETVQKYTSFYSKDIKPIIRSNYLSHLVTTIENMVNDKKMIRVLQDLDTNGTNGIAREKIRGFLASRTFRLYSIMLEPVKIKRRATTRYHPSGAIIFYNSCFEEKIIRILIAHELGHIVNKELLESANDSEQTANLFAFIAMEDKNKFYTEECTKYVSLGNAVILKDIISICPA